MKGGPRLHAAPGASEVGAEGSGAKGSTAMLLKSHQENSLMQPGWGAVRLAISPTFAHLRLEGTAGVPGHKSDICPSPPGGHRRRGSQAWW